MPSQMPPDGLHVNPIGCGVCSGSSATQTGESGHGCGSGGVTGGQGMQAAIRLTPKSPAPHARAITFHDISDLDRRFFMGPHVPTAAPLVTQAILS
jgi:hypothetical protein